MPYADPQKARENKRKKYWENVELTRQKDQAKRDRNREKIRARQQARYQAHKEEERPKRRAWLAKWESEHREEKNARMCAYRKTEKFKAYKESTRAKRSAKSLEWYHSPAGQKLRQKNKEKHKDDLRRWYQESREFYAEYRRLYGGKNRASGVFIKWEICGELCYICGEKVRKDEVNFDHVMPRARGGTNDIKNLMPVHRLCNIRKRHHLDYPIKRPDLIALASGVEAAPRKVMRVRRKNGTFLPNTYDPSIAA